MIFSFMTHAKQLFHHLLWGDGGNESGEIVSLFYWTASNFPLFQGETLSLPSKLSVIYVVLKKIVGKKFVSAPAPKTCRFARDPWRIISQSISQESYETLLILLIAKTYLNHFCLGTSPYGPIEFQL